MNYLLLLYTTMFVLSQIGLYSLRKNTISFSFSRYGPIIGFGTILQKVIGPLAVLAFIVIAIINARWYTPFLYLFLGGISSVILGWILVPLRIIKPSPETGYFGMVLYTLINCASVFFLLTVKYN